MTTDYTTINGQPLPPGIWYFSRITETDRAGYVWITALMMLIVPLCFCAIRFYVRFGAYQSDDWMLAAATLIGISQHSVVIFGLKKGLGRSTTVLTEHEVYMLEKILLVAQILFVCAHTASKLSIALFVRRLFDNGRRRNIVLGWTVIGVSAMWGVAALFILLVNCTAFHFLSPSACPGLFQRWQVVTALDVISEITLIAAPTYLVSSVLIELAPKMLVVSAFSFRTGPIIFTIVHLDRVKLDIMGAIGGFSYLMPIIWIQVLVGVSLMTASIPTFKAFMHPFEKEMVPYQRSSQNASRSRDTKEFGGYLMMGPGKPPTPNPSRHKVSGRSDPSESDITGRIRKDTTFIKTSIRQKSRASSTGDDSIPSRNSSQERIFRQEPWEVKVK